MSVKIIATTDKYDDCQRCHREGLKRVVVIRGEVDGQSVSGHYGTECVWRAMGYPARIRPAILNRKIAEANAEADRQRYLLETWSQFLAPGGVAVFYSRNPTCDPSSPVVGRFAEDEAGVIARATRVVAEAAAYLAGTGE